MKPLYPLCAALLCSLSLQLAPAAAQALPEVQQQGAVSFVTGGVGSDEAAAFRAAAAQYNLRLTLSTVSGESLAGVKVVLRDARGRTVADAVSEGPYLFFNAPPGKYEVVADSMGRVQRRAVVVHAKGGSELYLRWQAAPEQ